MYKNDGIIRRYSEDFKLKVLAELSTGKYNKSQLGRFFGINRTTINKRIEQYDGKDLMNTRILVETNDEIGRRRIKALQKALRLACPASRVLDPSDRGIQYCSCQYVAVLSKRNIRISMTEENHCYENAIDI